MTTTPRLGAPELVSGQAVPETTVNEQIRFVEQGASYFIAKDKDLATPPGSPADGDCYIVAGSPTGAWTGWANRLAIFVSTAWVSITPIEGTRAYLQDENAVYEYSGAAWAAVAAGYTDEQVRDVIGTALQATTGGGLSVTVDDAGDTIKIALACSVTTQTGTSYTAVIGDGNSRIRFTNASTVTFTVPPNSSVAFPIGTMLEVEQAGAGAVVPTAGAGVTIRNRSGYDQTSGQYAVAGLRKVATDEWSLTGDLT